MSKDNDFTGYYNKNCESCLSCLFFKATWNTEIINSTPIPRIACILVPWKNCITQKSCYPIFYSFRNGHEQYCSFANSKSQRASFKIDINQLFQKLSPASDCRATSSHFLFPQDLCEQQQRQKTEQRTTLTAACLPPPCRRRRCRLRCCP